MFIDTLQLIAVRCYENLQLSFGRGVNVFVGENNSGKSTIMHSLLELQDPKLSASWIRPKRTELQVRIGLNELDMRYFSDTQKAAIHRAGGVKQLIATARFLANGSADRKYEVPGGPIDRSLFSQERGLNFLYPYLSARRTANLSENIGTAYSQQVSGSLEHIQSKVDALCTSPELRPVFEKHCKDVLGFVVGTFQTGNGKAAGLEVHPRQSSWIRVMDMGAGVVHALGLIVDFIYAENQVFVIEEPENDLHPRALKALLDLLLESTERGNQVFVTTHSNVVVRHLGAAPNAQLFHVHRVDGWPPASTCEPVERTAAARRHVLAELGYQLADAELYEAWLILEESSGERIIREFLVPWFVESLVGKLRTVAASGVSDLAPKLLACRELFLFLFLEKGYGQNVRVFADGDAAGIEAVEKLRAQFADWPKDRFSNFDQPQFERYYPAAFDSKVTRVLGMKDKAEQRRAKKALFDEVIDWLRPGTADIREALEESARPVIKHLQAIAASLSARS